MIRPLTRDDVVRRAWNAFYACGYVWGGTISEMKRCAANSEGIGEYNSAGHYIATDCSGFTSWAWGLSHYTSHQYGDGTLGALHPRANNTGNFEIDFPGILPGDVLWREGHVIIYVGDNHWLSASTKTWANSTTGRGMSEGNGVPWGKYLGYIAFDSSRSPEYDTDIPINVWNPSPGTSYPPDYNGGLNDDISQQETYRMRQHRYTRKYEIMKAWRN